MDGIGAGNVYSNWISSGRLILFSKSACFVVLDSAFTKARVWHIANTVFFAFGLQIGIEYIPEPSNLYLAYFLLIAGVWISGAGGALYITCGLGTGPRDGIMLGFLGKSKLPITVVRALIEIVVLVLGYFLGGLVGIGTIIIARLIGRAFSFWFNLYGKFSPR